MATSTGKKSGGKQAEPTLGGAIAGLALLTNRIEALDVFGKSGISFSDWLFLSTLRRNPDLKTGGVGRRLGLTPQRATQIVKSLTSAGHVNSTPSSADPRKKDLAITDGGAKACAQIEAEIGKRLAPALSNRPKIAAQLHRVVLSLNKALAAKGEA